MTFNTMDGKRCGFDTKKGEMPNDFTFYFSGNLFNIDDGLVSFGDALLQEV